MIDKDEFVRLSLNKILKKYGFEVEEVEDVTELEGRRKDLEGGIILADLDAAELEKWSSLLKRWNDRFILMTLQVNDDLTPCLEKLGVHHVLKKPVEPKLLKRTIRKIPFPNQQGHVLSQKKKRASVRV